MGSRSLLAVVLAATAVAATSATSSAATPAPKAGLVGSVLTLDAADQLSGYDVVVDPATGTSYVGWIADQPGPVRTVKLCVLPPGASACEGGVRSTDGLDGASAAGLRVVLTGPGALTLVWFHDTSPGSVDGPRGGRIAAAAFSGGVLSPGADVADALSFGQLFDAEAAPDGEIWTVTGAGAVPTAVEMGTLTGAQRQAVGAAFGLDDVRLAFTGTGAGVLSAVRYGSVSEPVQVSGQPAKGAPFPSFTGVPGTSAPTAAVTSAAGTVRLATVAPTTDEVQVVSSWKATAFGRPAKTGYKHSCPDLGEDATGDDSGRVTYAAYTCSAVAVGNIISSGSHAKTLSIPSGGTVTYVPAVASAPSGRARVAWSISKPDGAGGHLLQTAAVLLPAVPLTVTARAKAGALTLTYPGPCLPPVGAALAATAKAGKGWKVAHVKLTLGGATVPTKGTLDGSKLKPASSRRAKATVTLTKGGAAEVVHVAATVLACPAP